MKRNYLRKLIFLLSFSQDTPLHKAAFHGRLEICRLLVESKADVAARTRYFSPPPSLFLSLTICLAAVATLHSNGPSAGAMPTLLHTCTASVRRNDALPHPATYAEFFFVPPKNWGIQNKFAPFVHSCSTLKKQRQHSRAKFTDALTPLPRFTPATGSAQHRPLCALDLETQYFWEGQLVQVCVRCGTSHLTPHRALI